MDISKLKAGDIVQHKLSKDWLMVMKNEKTYYNENILQCRTKQLDIKEFYDYELEPK